MKYLFLLIIIFLIIVYFLQNKKHNIESFDNSCNGFFNKNSFCAYDYDTQKCGCRFQKDDLRYIFDSPFNCCNRICDSLSQEECLDISNNKKIPYYCNIGGNCVKNEGTIVSSHISANYCGNDPLNNQLLLPYTDEESCMKSVDVCDKYNIPSRSKNVNKEQCLKDFNCGYCVNKLGSGKCISGTASGPNDLQKYYYCEPSNVSGTNEYIYGNHAAYLLQK
jgi:hypothetical protein